MSASRAFRPVRHRLPIEMQTRLRAYLHQRKHIGRAESAQHVVHSLSSALQVEVTLLVHGDWLKHLWFLREAEHGCLVEVSARMEPRVYAPGELPERKHLYVIHHGIVLYAARVLTSGKMWGEDIILENEQNHLEHVRVAFLEPRRPRQRLREPALRARLSERQDPSRRLGRQPS